MLDNNLSRTPGSSAELEGIVVGYTGPENEVVFRNTVNDMDLGFVGEGECADIDNDPWQRGLQFQCNTNVENATNFTSRVANGTPVPVQGRQTIRARQGTPAYSASNVFDGNQHFDVLTSSELVYVEYNYSSGQGPATYTQVDPNDLDADYLLPIVVTGTINCGTSEDPANPVYVVGGGHTFTELKPYLASTKYTYGDLRYQYEELIDDGETDEVVQEIMDSWPQDVWDLRDYLLGLSPNLSVDALKSMVNKAYMPAAVKAEICIANPDATKKEGFLKWAELEATYPIPGYLIETIEASWDTRTYRTALEEQLTDQHTKLTQTAYYALYLLQTDTTPPPPDTLRWVWQQLRTNRARYAEAALLMGQADYTEAAAVINAMPAEKDQKAPEELERLRMLTYIGVLGTAAGDGRNAYQLSSTEVTALETMVGENYDVPSNWASNLLCAAYGKCRAPYTGNANAPKSNRSHNRTRPMDAPAQATYGLQPNPARGWVSFSYQHAASGTGQGSIVVRELAGRVLATLPMSGPQGQVVWDTRGLAPGTYLVEYRSAAALLHTEKLVIQQ